MSWRADFAPFAAGTIVLRSAASSASGLPEGTVLARLRAVAGDGRDVIWPLRLGEETADWSEAAAPAGGSGSRRPPVGSAWPVGPDRPGLFGHAYRAELALDPPLEVRALEVRLEAGSAEQAGAGLRILAIDLVAPAGPVLPR